MPSCYKKRGEDRGGATNIHKRELSSEPHVKKRYKLGNHLFYTPNLALFFHLFFTFIRLNATLSNNQQEAWLLWVGETRAGTRSRPCSEIYRAIILDGSYSTCAIYLAINRTKWTQFHSPVTTNLELVSELDIRFLINLQMHGNWYTIGHNCCGLDSSPQLLELATTEARSGRQRWAVFWLSGSSKQYGG
jgi:hypothetical protein